MDIIEFLEPVIEKRTEEIMNDVLRGETKEDYMKFVGLLQLIDPQIRNELENYYLNSVLGAVRTSYTNGLLEASDLRNRL